MTDGLAARFPVSIKGVVERDGHFVLLKNERDGVGASGRQARTGRSDRGLSRPRDRRGTELAGRSRQAAEQLGLLRQRRPCPRHHLRAAKSMGDEADMRISHEHKQLRSFPLQEIAGLRMPDGYKRSIALHAENTRNRANGEPDGPRA